MKTFGELNYSFGVFKFKMTDLIVVSVSPSGQIPVAHVWYLAFVVFWLRKKTPGDIALQI